MATVLALVQEIARRLRRISRAAGYYTDAGKAVYHGPIVLSLDDETDPDAAAIILEMPTESAVGGTSSRKLQRTLTLTLALPLRPMCARGEALELGRLDVFRALEMGNDTVAALLPSRSGRPDSAITYQSARLVPRQDGNNYEGLEMTFGMDFIEQGEEKSP